MKSIKILIIFNFFRYKLYKNAIVAHFVHYGKTRLRLPAKPGIRLLRDLAAKISVTKSCSKFEISNEF